MPPSEPFQTGGLLLRRPILYTTTTTTQRGWCIETVLSILAYLQSQKPLPGGGGVTLTSQRRQTVDYREQLKKAARASARTPLQVQCRRKDEGCHGQGGRSETRVFTPQGERM